MKTQKQWKKKFFGISLATLTVVSTLSVGLTSCSSGSALKYENLINPGYAGYPGADDAKGRFMSYGTRKTAAPSTPVDDKIVDVTYEKVMHGLLEDYTFASAMADTAVKNVIVNWFAGIKKSKNFLEEYTKMVEDINKSWDELVKNTKKQYGDAWQYHMQVDVLDQNGGTYQNWYYNQLAGKIMSSFDNLMTSNIKIGIEGYDGNLTHHDLFDPDGLVWKGWAAGQRNNISFTSGVTSSQDFSIPVSDFWEFVFDQYVKEKMPLVTSMVLFKHDTASTNLGNFFDIQKIKEYDGYQTNDIVGTTGSYKWQAYPNKSIVTSTGDWNTTDKYNNFVADYGTKGENSITSNIGGAINIDVKYTDDSATLYRINLNDVFTSSFTPYAAGSTYKFNSALPGFTADTGIATTAGFNTNLLNAQEGTEIMGNFLSTNASEAGHLALNPLVTNIIDKNATSTPGFIGKYNGMKSIADIVNVNDSPFILARNEAGVHIIGIDRFDAIKTAAATSYQNMINEIKNTLLWRSLVSNSEDEKKMTGFTLDITSDLPSYYQQKKTELIYKYIKAKEAQRGDTAGSGTNATWESKGHEAYAANRYLFSSAYTSTIFDNGIPKLDDNGELVPATNDTDGEYNKLFVPEQAALFDKNYVQIDYNSFVSTPKDINKLLTTQDPYESKWVSYSGVENGIAGMISFTPTIPTPGADIPADAPNDQIYYKSLLRTIPVGGDAAPLSFTNTYKDSEFNKFTEQFKTAANTFYTYLNKGVAFDPNTPSGTFVLKNVDYPKYEENIFLQSPEVEKQKEAKTYMNVMTTISNKVNQEYSNGFKSMAEVEKTLAGIDDRVYKYDDTAGATNLSMLAQPATAPTTPSDNADTVNYYLEKAITQSTRLDAYTGLGANTQLNGQWIDATGVATYDNLIKVAQSKNKLKITKKYSQDSLTTFKQFLAYQYAFDFNPETGKYEFTKFRDYLLNSTANFQKAAFIWRVSNYDGAFTTASAYGKNLDKDFSFKNPLRINGLTSGYAFKDSPKVALYTKDGTASTNGVGYFDGDKISLTQDNGIFNQVKMKPATGAEKDYVGFKGIQFQSSNSLDPSEATSIFNSNIKVKDASGNFVAKGALYNLGSGDAGKKELTKRISELNNWDQIRRSAEWLHDEFNLDPKPVYDVMARPDSLISEGIDALKTLANGLDAKVFERVQGEQVGNSSLVNSNPAHAQFFGEDRTNKSQIVISQFNHSDVLKLFNTDTSTDIDNGDGTKTPVIDANDHGINPDAFTSNDFLGQGFEAFMFAAYNWAATDQTFVSIAYNNMLKVQNNLSEDAPEADKKLVVQVYSRPLNDEFGKDWAGNYKESVKVK